MLRKGNQIMILADRSTSLGMLFPYRNARPRGSGLAGRMVSECETAIRRGAAEAKGCGRSSVAVKQP
jgi:hypothetical protein